MRYHLFAFVAALASVSTLAFAQQPVQTAPGQVVPGQVIQGQVIQGQVVPGQPAQGQVVPGQAQGHGGQQQQRRGGMASQGQGVSLEAFIAHKLKRGNEAEVELGKLASERAESDSVKQFAQEMVKVHTEMISKIDQLDLGMEGRAGGNQRGQNQPGQNQPGQNQPGQPGRGTSASIQPTQSTGANTGIDASANADLNQRRGDNVRNSESNTNSERQAGRVASSVGGSQSASATGATPGSTDAGASTTNSTTVGQAVGQTGTTGQTQAGRNQAQAGRNQGGQAGQAGQAGMSGQVPQMLVALSDQTCDNEMQLTKEMLEQYKGSDFEMAYIGQQIVQHTCMLAHLQALKSSGPAQFQQLASEGERTTREHLDHAKKIAKELGSDKNSK